MYINSRLSRRKYKRLLKMNQEVNFYKKKMNVCNSPGPKKTLKKTAITLFLMSNKQNNKY
nr:hypothetical protein Itr_chr07CG18710 [Ipomoea trifida]